MFSTTDIQQKINGLNRIRRYCKPEEEKQFDDTLKSLNQALNEAREKEKKEKELAEKRDEMFLQACINNVSSNAKELFNLVSSFTTEMGLALAAYHGSTEVVKQLLEKNVSIINHASEINYDKVAQTDLRLNDPIHNAIRGDHPDILRLLIPYAVKQLEVYARFCSCPENLKFTQGIQHALLNPIREGRGIDQQLFYGLHYSVETNERKYVDFAFMRSQPLLTEAALLDATQCVKLLHEEFNADPSSRLYEAYPSGGMISFTTYTVKGSALTVAVANNNTDLSLYLLQKGAYAYVNMLAGNQLKQVSRSSAENSYSYSVKIWDEIRDVSALMLAAKNNNKILVAALLKAGADRTITDRNNKTACDYTKDVAIRELLQPVEVKENINSLNHKI